MLLGRCSIEADGGAAGHVVLGSPRLFAKEIARALPLHQPGIVGRPVLLDLPVGNFRFLEVEARDLDRVWGTLVVLVVTPGSEGTETALDAVASGDPDKPDAIRGPNEHPRPEA